MGPRPRGTGRRGAVRAERGRTLGTCGGRRCRLPHGGTVGVRVAAAGKSATAARCLSGSLQVIGRKPSVARTAGPYYGRTVAGAGNGAGPGGAGSGKPGPEVAGLRATPTVDTGLRRPVRVAARPCRAVRTAPEAAGIDGNRRWIRRRAARPRRTPGLAPDPVADLAPDRLRAPRGRLRPARRIRSVRPPPGAPAGGPAAARESPRARSARAPRRRRRPPRGRRGCRVR